MFLTLKLQLFICQHGIIKYRFCCYGNFELFSVVELLMLYLSLILQNHSIDRHGLIDDFDDTCCRHGNHCNKRHHFRHRLSFSSIATHGTI